ncbi:hypothetical protein H5410_001975 [Solanum commersonii]|uniref:Uncharacterized protein n=1 Tax=Solanum commersonii TaxID=4109 RepID=A0A9J6B125_SOLCO|nr:hypothetical protein H5410_001975 [Solanum commersonii]
MSRYLDTVCYTTTTVYKYRMHYEMIIKNILALEEWGMSPLKEMDYIHFEQKVAAKYNYWDYIVDFNKALLYENTNNKNSWFIKICGNIFGRHIPNWFCKWWILYSPSVKILLSHIKNYIQNG